MLCIRHAKVKVTFKPNGDVARVYAVSGIMSRTAFKGLFAHGKPDCEKGHGLAPVATGPLTRQCQDAKHRRNSGVKTWAHKERGNKRNPHSVLRRRTFTSRALLAD